MHHVMIEQKKGCLEKYFIAVIKDSPSIFNGFVLVKHNENDEEGLIVTSGT